MTKILIIDTYYPAFLNNFYDKHPKVADYSYGRQKNKLMSFMFGTADFYSNSLNRLGNPTTDIVLNNRFLQKKWASGNTSGFGINIFHNVLDSIVSLVPFVSGRVPLRWELEVLKKQIEYYKPDIIYSHNLGYIDPLFLDSIKPKIKLLVGQIASPLPPKFFLKPYDLIITSFPHFVKKLKKMGIKAEYSKLCFESSIIKKIPKQRRIYDVTFVGGISRAHTSGLKLLYRLAEEVNLDIWGYGKEDLDHDSKLYRSHHGEAWGRDMYKIFLQSKITINRHIDVAENYANNMRLYESTGCGAMLITDQKKNLNEIFSVGKEVVDYDSVNDLVNKIKYYLTNDKERIKIARNGQKRTLRDHNYFVRMRELADILNKYV